MMHGRKKSDFASVHRSRGSASPGPEDDTYLRTVVCGLLVRISPRPVAAYHTIRCCLKQQPKLFLGFTIDEH